MKIERLSVSDLKMAKMCEKKLYFKFTQHKPAKVSHYLVIGIVFHQVVADYLTEKHGSGKNWSLGEFEVVFNRAWEKEKERADFGKVGEMECRSQCWQYLQTYYQKRLGMLFPKADGGIERFFTFIAKDGQNGSGEPIAIKFVGKIDLITLDGSLIDHKTSSGKWTQADADNEPQAHFYPFMLKANGVEVQRFVFNVVTKKDVKVYEVIPNKDKFLKWVNYGFELQRNFPDNLMATNKPRICSMCEWRGICPDRKDLDDL